MFTGIIESVGVVKSISGTPGGVKAKISFPDEREGIIRGESISVNGVCLTVISKEGVEFEVEISGETLKKSNLERLAKGDRVNLERSLTVGGRLGGHMVYGHVDGIAVLVKRVKQGDSEVFELRIDDNIMKYIVYKGSVALNGVSLTVSRLFPRSFEVVVLPFTLTHTNLQYMRPGDLLNLEVDIIGKYVEKFLAGRAEDGMMGMLRKSGFMKEE